jgi:hypothetical protein
MTETELALWIQVAAVLAAVGASIVALKIASRASREALLQSKLMFELEALVRLLENNSRGGSTDALERAKLGAEGLALVGTLGPELLPTQWARKVNMDDAGLREHIADPTWPDWKKDQFETQLAVNDVSAKIRNIIAKRR